MSLTAKDKQELVRIFEEVAINALRPVNAALREIDKRMEEVEDLRGKLHLDIRAGRAAAALREIIRELVDVAAEEEERSS